MEVDPRKPRYYFKVFMKGGLGIDLVADYPTVTIWDEIRASRMEKREVYLSGFDDQSEEEPTAVVSFMADDVLAIVQRDLDNVQKQAAMQRLNPNAGPRLM